MAKDKSKYYVVWIGRKTGIFTTWATCKEQIDNFKGAKYKSFETRAEAEKAYNSSPLNYIKNRKRTGNKNIKSLNLKGIAVDAACSGNPGPVEYQGVDISTGRRLFHVGLPQEGTSNIGEFLALVHALAYSKKENLAFPIYTDSMTAIAWVKNRKSRTSLPKVPENQKTFDLITRAEEWLTKNTYTNEVLKWKTKEWGEIPADFGRK